MTKSIVSEIELQRNYLPAQNVETIYFGGGTPSLLTESQLNTILNAVYQNFTVSQDAEITLEANPDDLDKEKTEQFKNAGINRLSIGIQSFHEPHLQYLNRIHSAAEAGNCVKTAQDSGITNISIDLIYAIPAAGHTILLEDIQKASELEVSHISAYCLTIEPQTIFGNWLKKNKIKPVDEEFAATQFEILVRSLAENGYEQYEISNFAQNQHYSRHNSSYWKQRPYLGIGPSAHSYNGTGRQYNVSNNAKYLEAIQKGIVPATTEILTSADQTNEYILTGLRTKWGVKVEKLELLSQGVFTVQNGKRLENMLTKGWIRTDGGSILLTEPGKLFADRIASDLFID